MKLKRKIALLFTSISLFSLGVGESINANDNFNMRNTGSEYVGDINNGNRTGKGTKTFANGDKYVGDFVDGKSTGKGTYTWANGDKYVGDFVDGVFQGKGTVTLKNGKKIKGKWFNGNLVN